MKSKLSINTGSIVTLVGTSDQKLAEYLNKQISISLLIAGRAKFKQISKQTIEIYTRNAVHTVKI